MAAVRFTRGVKRKREEDGDEDGGVQPLPPPLAFHCEALLDLSLQKLHQGCTVADRNLRRSVLIANTLRRLQAGEGTAEGGPPPPQIQTQPEAPDPNINLDPELNLCRLMGDDTALSTALHHLDYPGGLGGSPPSPEEDPPLSPPAPRPLHSVLASLDMADSDAFLADCSLDDIFSDIDTSMYDGQTSLATAGLWDPLKPPDPAPWPLERPPWDHPSTRTEFTDLEMVMDLLAG